MFGPDSKIPMRSTAVACAVLRPKGDTFEFLVLRRTDPSLEGVWSLVTGHVEGSETGWQAAYREVVEETGLTPTSFYTANFCDQWYNAHANVIEVVPIFIAYVDKDAEVTLNDEHSELKWVSVQDAIEHVPFHGHKTMLDHACYTFVENPPPDFLRIDTDG